MRPKREGIGRRAGALLRGAAMAAAATVALLGAAASPAAAATPSPALPAPIERFVPVAEAPGSTARIRLDTRLYLPTERPAPAVLLAHGFGQDVDDLAPEARRLQGEGYVVLAYSARGFGRSGGRIGLDSLDGEVPDARALVDRLDTDTDVLHRGGDPVVGVVGASYGGALALMLGATDPRIDTVVAGITWNDLAQALDPVSSGSVDGRASERLFKSGWASRLFGAAAADRADPCSRFTADVCALYRNLVTGRAPTADELALLRRSSPSSVLDGMHAPTLLLQGLQDSLFGLDQADANARQIRAAHAPARVAWFDGGHDGDGIAGTDAIVDRWLADRLQDGSWWPARRFGFDLPASATAFAQHRSAGRYPGLDGNGPPARIALRGAAQEVVNPPGGEPTSTTSLPGIAVDGDAGLAAQQLFDARNPPGQAARFVSAPLTRPAVLAGAPRVRLRVEPRSSGAADVVLFAQLTVRTGSITRTLPGGVAPVRVTVPASGATIDVALPATTWQLAPGDAVVLTVRTTDSQFVGSATPAAFRVSVAGPIDLPEVVTGSASSGVALPTGRQVQRIVLLLAIVLLLVLVVAVVGRLRSRAGRRAEARAGWSATGPLPDAAPPLVLRGVTKRFRTGLLAVDDVSFSVGRGQVVGLLGENGAGKTTTLRMVLGLSRPDSGTIEAFGAPVAPGSPALRRIGAFVEGPGFLPYLSGRRNLRLFWAATGRPRREARLAEALAVADLGPAIRRRVGGYSQGMRQRLAIAQAMLGLPDLLVLDEPTNGLDPSQIIALRDVLRRYAEGGRTVVVSSHLLAEVERTCSHLVVMSHGRLVAAGPVAEIAGADDQLLVGVDDPSAAVRALAAAGVDSAEAVGDDAVRVVPGASSTGEVVAALVHAGVAVTDLRRERRLEDAFLDLVGEQRPRA